MKNSEDFRRCVLEKAKRYEEKRKARRKKLIETASLCSLCVVIGVSAYLVSSGFGFDHDVAMTTHSTPSTSTTPTDSMESSIDYTAAPTETASTPLETTAVTTTTTPAFTFTTTTSMTAITTTENATFETFATSTTQSSSIETEQNEQVTLPPAPIELDSLYGVEISPESTLSCEADPLPSADIYVIRSASVFQNALFGGVYDNRLTEEDKLALCKEYDEDFFEEHVLLMVYVPAKWTAYQVSYRDGAVSAFLNIEMAKGYDYALHTYILPKHEENLGRDFLLTYEETP